jgi:hypothetical protein
MQKNLPKMNVIAVSREAAAANNNLQGRGGYKENDTACILTLYPP